MEPKHPVRSKTVWFNLIVALAAFVPAVSEWVKAHPEMVMQGLVAVNVLLRFLTKDKLSLDA